LYIPGDKILEYTSDLLSHLACSLSHFSNSPIHFGIFPKLYGNLLSHFARWLSHFSNSRIGHIPHHQLSHRQSQLVKVNDWADF
jgi:hypothetical protein